jgi:hypothetical protein
MSIKTSMYSSDDVTVAVPTDLLVNSLENIFRYAVEEVPPSGNMSSSKENMLKEITNCVYKSGAGANIPDYNPLFRDYMINTLNRFEKTVPDKCCSVHSYIRDMKIDLEKMHLD